MDALEAIAQRRATKQFDASFNMPLEEQKNLLNIALQNAPSAYNLQHWRPLLVIDRAQREKIRAAAAQENDAQVANASMLVVLCGDPSSWESHVKTIWQDAPKPEQDFIMPKIDDFYRDKPDVQRDEVMTSAGIFAQTLMLAAKAKGYESGTMGAFDYDAVGKIINKPAHYRVCLMIAIGKGIADPDPRIGKLPADQIIGIDRY